MGLEETICVKGQLNLEGKIAGKPVAIPISVDTCKKKYRGARCEVPLFSEKMPVSVGRFTIATIEVPDKDWAIPAKDIRVGPVKIAKGLLLRIKRGDFFKMSIDAALGGNLDLDVSAWAPVKKPRG